MHVSERLSASSMSLRRRYVALAGAFIALTWQLSSTQVRAEQTRDWMISAPQNGTDAFVDLILPGVQAGIEHKLPIYGKANQLTFRGNALYMLPFYESQGDVELRMLVLTLGASGGFRSDFNHFGFAPDESFDSHARRLRFVNGRFDTATWGFGEGRATLSLPINDYVLFNAINYLRFEASPDRSFDWRNGIVHDGGMLFKSDIMLFLKHRDVGGFAPMVQVLNFGLGASRFTQLNYGFTLAMRPGFQRGYDILFLQLLFNPGSTFGTYDNSRGYGLHLLFAPISFTLAYRMVIPVQRSER
jgi:hypothetical protein